MSETLLNSNSNVAMKQCYTGFVQVKKHSQRYDLMEQYEATFQGLMDYGPLLDYDDEHPGQLEAILAKSLAENKPFPEYLPESKDHPWPEWLPKHTLKINRSVI